MHRYPGVPEVLAIHADVCAQVRGQNLVAEEEAVPPEIQGLARAGWRGLAQEGEAGQTAGGPQA
eukprot:7589011-Lingulodinium_polyedra.AAC.1